MGKRSASRRSQKRKNEITHEEIAHPDAFNLFDSLVGRPRFGFLGEAAIETLKNRAFEILE